MMRRDYCLCLAVICALGGCARQGDSPRAPAGGASPAPVTVAVSIPPQAYLAEALGGDRVAVQVLVPPGQSHASYDPTAKQIVALGDADVYFRIGVPFEAGLIPKVESALPGLKIVDVCEGVELRPMDEHGAEAGHAHGAADPHTWLDPTMAKAQARAMALALMAADPAGTAAYEANLKALEAELDEADAQVSEILAPHAGRTMLVFHPSFGYFADRYGLKQRAIEVEGKEPSAKALRGLVDDLAGEDVSAIFVQREFASNAVEIIARELGAEVVTLDPLARDYTANLLRMAELIAEGLGGGVQ